MRKIFDEVMKEKVASNEPVHHVEHSIIGDNPTSYSQMKTCTSLGDRSLSVFLARSISHRFVASQ